MLEKIKQWFGLKKSPVDDFAIGSIDGKWYIFNHHGEKYAGPYKREKDAKGQLTRLRKGYTPAARKV